MSRRTVFSAVSIVLVLCGGIAIAKLPVTEDAYGKLLDGNKRFVAGNSSRCDLTDARRKALTAGQHPSAIVVTCSDSRVVPEHIFNQGLGDIFVIRTAGNVLDPVALGSVEYAAEHLHTHLLVIMGHDQCGAVAAAMNDSGKAEGNIGAIIEKIRPAVDKARTAGGTKDEQMNRAIRENVALSHNAVINQSLILKHLVESGELQVVETVYHLDGGQVEMLSAPGAPVSHSEHATLK